MSRVYIRSGARTPIGCFDGNLKGYTEQKLAAAAMKLALEQSKLPAENLSEIIVGTAKQTSLPSNCARYAMLEARLPDSIPAYTVQRQSASGLQAVLNAYWQIKCGLAEAVMAGGCESMSNIPREIHDARYAFNENTRIIFDPIGAQFSGAQPKGTYGELNPEQVAANISSQFSITPAELEEAAAKSLEGASKRGEQAYICGLDVKKGKVVVSIAADECYQAPEQLARPADAAAMLVLCGETWQEGSMAELLAVSSAAGSPRDSGYIATEAMESALKKAGVSAAEIQLVDICEMSAAQQVVTQRKLGELGINQAQINPLGGGLATGSPWGAAGAVQLVDTMHFLHEHGLSLGMVITPAEGGQTMCAIIKRV